MKFNDQFRVAEIVLAIGRKIECRLAYLLYYRTFHKMIIYLITYAKNYPRFSTT